MKCITSPALSDTQIESYIEGEAEDSVVVHIRNCPFCREKADRWSLLQNRLKKKLYRSTCPSPVELGDYHLGLLPASQVLVVAGHVRECPLCRRELAQLEDYLTALEPRSVLPKAVRVLIGRLVGPRADGPASGTAAPALRGEMKGPLIFAADGIVVTLDVQPGRHGQIFIQGQMAADEQDQWTGAVVRVQQTDMPDLTASLDDLGAFVFEEVRPGSMDLKITSLNGIEVQILNIELAI